MDIDDTVMEKKDTNGSSIFSFVRMDRNYFWNAESGQKNL